MPSPETIEALAEYRWPGSIRELEDVIERAVILSPASTLPGSLQDLHFRIAPGGDNKRRDTLAEVEREPFWPF